MNQMTTLIAKKEFGLKLNGTRGRAAHVKVGDRFVVTTAGYMNVRDGMANIDRESKASIGSGYRLTIAQIEELFEIAA